MKKILILIFMICVAIVFILVAGSVTFEKTVLKKYQYAVKFIPHIIKDTFSAFAWMNERPYWTTDNFGPLAIPPDCYFVLGNNRHNAQDSRCIGFINKHNIMGVLLNK